MTTAFVDFNGVVPEKVRLQVAVWCELTLMSSYVV